MRPAYRAFCLALLCLSLSSLLSAQRPKNLPPAKPVSETAATGAPQYDQKLFGAMRYRLVGPFRGGRVLAVEGVVGEPNVYYFGAVAGGVWKTTDGGDNWKPLFDHYPVSSIGALDVSRSNHNVIYVGTGEACIRGNISYGDGVYKSTDGGISWKNVGLKDSQHIGAIVVDPSNPDVVFVAALGHAYGPNSERGIFRTTDGGKTWTKVLYKDDKTGAIDVAFDPNNSNILYAALWEAYRTPYSLNSGGPGSGLYKSEDGGTTWKHLEGNGLPDGIMGRIGVTVSGGDSNRVYALIEAKKGGLYRSDDAGQNWTLVNDDGRFRQRAWYFTHVFADPKSPDTLYILNTGAYKSTDAGRTFTLLPAPHGDHHGLWIDPTNPQRLINGNDGGTTISTDGGKTWTSQLNQPTAQFYHVITDNRWPYYIYGAQQDNSTVGIASYDDEGVITMRDWYAVGGGESGYIAPDPRDGNIVYAGSDAATITRYDHRTEQEKDISVWPEDTSGEGAKDLKYRFQWTAPVMISPNDPDVLYTSAQFVFESKDHGQSWQTISPDLTRNDKSRQQPSGGPLTKDITSVEYYDTVFALAESPKKRGLLWAGTDDGLIHITQDDGAHWANVTPKTMPEWSMVSLIEASPFDEGTAYVAVDRHKLDDFKPYIFKTSDYGKSWSPLNNGIPEGAYVHSVREDPKRKGLLYAGTETGLYVSFNDGQHWQPLQLNLPSTPIHDLAVKDDDLVVATHGRSFWVLDDITPLRQITSELAARDTVLYTPEPAYRLHYPEQVDARRPVGQDPPPGAILDYYFASEPKGEVKLEIYDSQGKLIRSLSSVKKKDENEQPPEWPDQIQAVTTIPAKVGMNRYAWDLRYESPVKIPNSFYSDSGPIGPLVMPGTYEVKLIANGQTLTQPLEIKLDPRIRVSQADMQKQFDLAMKVYQSNNELHTAVNQIREMRANLDRLSKRFDGDARLKPVVAAAGDLSQKAYGIEEGLIQVNMKGSEANLAFPNELNEKFDTFVRSVESADGAPTKQQYEVYDYLNGDLQKLLAAWQQVQNSDVKSFNAMIEKYQVPFLPESIGGGQASAGGAQR
ncbi:MAG TPA: hypothetical protein VFQ00_13080 [Terriglobales bacterium]|nr:hypothetical protein [Terriglobales bacterium]